MKRITQGSKIIYEAQYIEYPKLYEALTGRKPDMSNYCKDGTIDGLSYSEFIDTNNLSVEARDNPHRYFR